MTSRSFEESMQDLDVDIFRVESQTHEDDRRSLLAIQNAVRSWKDSYVYLECGSHVGGSLFPHVIDPRCRLAFSVDKRSAAQPDERGVDYSYPSNSTRRMLDSIAAHAPSACMAKLRTFDTDSSTLTNQEILEQPDLIMIDAEHTNHAAFNDFLNIFRLCAPSAVVLFHDANLIYSALQNIESFLRYNGTEYESYAFPSCVFVLAINDARQAIAQVAREFGQDKERYFSDSKQELIRHHYAVFRERLSVEAAIKLSQPTYLPNG